MTLAAIIVVAAPAAESVVPGWVVLLAGCLLGGLLLALRSPTARMARQQRRLHRELAAANGLLPAESRLLWRLAVLAGQENPTLVFVRPGMFDAGAAVAKADAGLVRAIRSKLFGG